MQLDRASETMCEKRPSTLRPSNTKGCITANNFGRQGDAVSDVCQKKPENHSCRFTVCTPTFNRGRTLHRVYDSLIQQTYQDFEWLIIDDESTDNTAEIVQRMRKEAPFEIRYLWQRHGHKKAAVNYGAKAANGEFILIWDSDDAAPPTAMEDLLAAWDGIPSHQRESFAGVWGVCALPSGEIVGKEYPANIVDSDHASIQYRYRVCGEKWGFVRTKILREFPYPETVQGYVPEGVVWARIGKHYKTRYINKVVRFYYDECDSLTRRRSGAWDNSPGLALWAAEVLGEQQRFFWKCPGVFFHAAVNATRFWLHGVVRGKGVRLPRLPVFARLLLYLCAPVGLLVFCRDFAGESQVILPARGKLSVE